MIEVCEVTTSPDFTLCLLFNNGENRTFDMRPYLQYPVFRRLENTAFFSLARVDYGTVTWPGDIDIAPETLYDRSVPLL
ncbi:DUF2442 domain-containing protein [Geobacter argillaceus]|uniref:DUF2442 domain-containing protein n=1 Tax=Geobacter argillaceus TaxID=345631 RepID=UPI0011A57941|nr:DUF2442 domain-containing protein [Geobacter argillaceus]